MYSSLFPRPSFVFTKFALKIFFGDIFGENFSVRTFSLGFVTTLSCLGGFRGECVPCCCLCTEAAIAPMAVVAAAASAASAAFAAAVLLLLLRLLPLLLLPLLLFPPLPSFQRWHGHCARMRRKSREANRPSPLTFPQDFFCGILCLPKGEVLCIF